MACEDDWHEAKAAAEEARAAVMDAIFARARVVVPSAVALAGPDAEQLAAAELRQTERAQQAAGDRRRRGAPRGPHRQAPPLPTLPILPR